MVPLDDSSPIALAVDDSVQILKLIGKTLRENGYRVLTAIDGLDAIRICSIQTAPITLAVLDVVMPNLSGLDLAPYLLQRYPRIQILYTSGYTASVAAECLQSQSPLQFIQKPFNPNELLEQVRNLSSESRSVPSASRAR